MQDLGKCERNFCENITCEKYDGSPCCLSEREIIFHIKGRNGVPVQRPWRETVRRGRPRDGLGNEATVDVPATLAEQN